MRYAIGGGASAHVQGLAEREQCDELIADVLSTHGRVDALAHNAGIARYSRIAESPRASTSARWRSTPTPPGG